MFKDGYIFNYIGGAKGDFLIRFLSNLEPSINEFGATNQTSYFSKFKQVEGKFLNLYSDKKIRLQKYNEIFPEILSTSNTIWPQGTHTINFLSEENYNLLKLKYKNIYDIIVEEENYIEVSINHFFKNFTKILPNHMKLDIQKNYNSKFNGQYIIDREFFFNIDKNVLEYNNSFRIKALVELWKNELKTYKKRYDDYKKFQYLKNTHKLYYSKLFKPPYEDLVILYEKINKKSPNIDLYKKLVSQTYVPNELVFFDHKIRLNYESDNIIEVLGRISDETI